jgi:DNA topoisomerase-1
MTSAPARRLHCVSAMIAATFPGRSNGDDVLEPQALARAARLHYVSDEEAGIQRRKNGHGFVYVDPRGRRLRSERMLERIQSLAIPPAWTDVWICRDAEGHLQVTGRDQRQRKQYIYHPRWREASNLAKFRRLLRFGLMLPEVRQKVNKQLGQRKDSREKVCSLVLALLDQTSIRVGNEEYVQDNDSYGLTTLRRRHIAIESETICFRFRGKSGKKRCVEVRDRRLARLVARCCGRPGDCVFTYPTDGGGHATIASDDVNSYLRDLTRESFTAKDFRTWKGSAVAAGMLFDQPGVAKKTQRRKIVSQVAKGVGELLGNTPTVCRKYYIHPELLESYIEGDFHERFDGVRPRRRKWLTRDDQLLIQFLQTVD